VATIHDVARLAGVSYTTAHRALNTPDLVAPETLKGVQQAVESLRYEPNHIAGALRRGRTNTVGLLLGTIIEPFFSSLTYIAGNALRSHGYSLLVADSRYDVALELENLQIFSSNKIAGLIIRSANLGGSNLDYLKRLGARGTAIVEIDYRHPDSPFDYVLLDNESCVDEAVGYFHGLGHTRIAILGSYDPAGAPEERSRFFQKAMAARGLPIPEAYHAVIDFTEESVRALTRQLLSLDDPPTALLAVNGNGGMGAFRAIREMGLRIPEDVSLMSFDNYRWTTLVEPQIDVIAQPVEQMADAAVRSILNHLQNGPATERVRKSFSGTLIHRGSSASPKAFRA
jgi:LacI family transcriptional regulator